MVNTDIEPQRPIVDDFCSLTPMMAVLVSPRKSVDA